MSNAMRGKLVNRIIINLICKERNGAVGVEYEQPVYR